MKFENISLKTKAIILDGKWYNKVDEKVLSFANNLGKGSEVEIQQDQTGKITRLNVLNKVDKINRPEPVSVTQVGKKQVSNNASFALSYAKDLAVAGKIEVKQIIEYAEVFRKYLDEGIANEDLFPIAEEVVEG